MCSTTVSAAWNRAVNDCIEYKKTPMKFAVGRLERSSTRRRLDLEGAPRTRILVLTGDLCKNDARHLIRSDGGFHEYVSPTLRLATCPYADRSLNAREVVERS